MTVTSTKVEVLPPPRDAKRGTLDVRVPRAWAIRPTSGFSQHSDRVDASQGADQASAAAA
jgi:hypothetical protein